MMPRVIETLKSTPRMLFVYRWFTVKEECRKKFGWTPEVVEVADVAKENGISPSLDAFAEKTVGGKFCRRASNFGEVGLPSEVARHHHAIRATMMYEFAVKFRRLREKRSGAPGTSSNGVGDVRESVDARDVRRRRDQERLSPDARRQPHRSRGRDQEATRNGSGGRDRSRR